MGYRRVTAELLWCIYSRRRAGQSNRDIATTLRLDKKTVNSYAKRIEELGLANDLGYAELLQRLAPLIPRNAKPKPAFGIFKELEKEIRSLIRGDQEVGQEPMKAKTAWEVIRDRHELCAATSYESFKRFIRARQICAARRGPVVRIESEPGEEVQVDYGQVGRHTDGARMRIVRAFCAILSWSRLPYVRFGFTEDEVAFAQAVSGLFTFYGGVTERINLDNLKAGILDADIYNPTLNRTFAELCEYYGVIPDPARPRSPGQGKSRALCPGSPRTLSPAQCALSGREPQ